MSAFRLESAGFEALLQGPVMADLLRRGIRVQRTAIRLASNAPPSAPGQGPGVRTGRLRASITYRAGLDGLSPFVDIGTAVTYAPYLELGTKNMAARPFLRPALESAR